MATNDMLLEPWWNHMNDTHKTAISLFLLFLLCFAVFAHWIGDNSNSRLATTAAIVEDGTTQIDAYINHTGGDYALVNGRYYSDKAPLPSLLAVPSYLVVDTIFGGAAEFASYTDSFRRTFSEKMVWARWSATVSVSGVAGAVTVVLLYLICLQLGFPRSTAKMLGAIAGFGTLIFPYSTTFYGTMTGTMFLTAAVYLWIRETYTPSPRTILLIGGALGLGVSASYLIIVPGIVLSALLVSDAVHADDGWVLVEVLGLGWLMGLTPLLLYNFSVFGHPFDLNAFHIIPEYASTGPGSTKYSPARLMYLFSKPGTYLLLGNRLVRMLFYPLNGLFLFTPLLLLSVPGCRTLYREHRRLVSFILPAAVASLLFAAYIWVPSRVFFGPRYLLPAATLLFIPAAVAVRGGGRKKTLFAILGAVSTLNMVASTQLWTSRPLQYYNENDMLRHFHVIDNRLGTYLQTLPTDGLQSPIIAALGHFTDRLYMVLGPAPDTTRVIGTAADTVFVLDYRFLLPALVAGPVLLLFRSEVRQRIPGRPIAIIGGLLFLLAVAGVSGHQTYHEDWHATAGNDTIRWGYETPTLYLTGDGGKTLLQYRIQSNHRPRNITITVNGNHRQHMRLPASAVEHSLQLDPGINRITFHTSAACTVISNDDPRCVTIGLENLSRSRPPKSGMNPGANIVQRQGSLMMHWNATMYAAGQGRHLLYMDAKTIGNTTTLRIFKDGVPVTETRIDPFGGPVSTPVMELNGSTVFTFQTGCPEHCELINVSGLTLQRFSEQPRDRLYRFGTNWYHKIPAEQYRWSSGNATIHIYNYDDQAKNRTLRVSGRAFHIPRNITYLWNGQRIGTRTVQTTAYRTIRNASGAFRVDNRYGFPVTVQPGENQLELGSPTSCTSVGAVNDNNDVRCAVFGIEQLNLTQD